MSLVRRSFVPLLLGLMVLLLQGATIQAQVRTQINLSTTVDCLSQVVVADHTTRDKLTAISALSPSDAWAVGPNQLAYHWDGSMWTVVTLPPAPSGSAAQPYTVVSMIASNDVWAIQNYFQSDGVHTNTQIVHWDGSSWSVVPNPQPGSLLNDLNGVKALAPNDVWAVGSSGNSDGVRFTVTLHWNGSIWSQVPSPSPGMVSDILEAVDGRASNDVWAVGSPADTMVLHWNGNVWSLFSIPNSSTANHLHSVSMIASNDVWAVGDVDSAGVPSAYAAHWDGNTWTQVPVPQVGSSSSLMGVKALFATEVYAVGNYISNVEKTLGFRWNGSEWTQITADSPSVGAYFTAVDGGGGSNLWAVGTHQISHIRSSVLIEQPCLASTPSPTQTPTVTTTSTAGGTTPTPTATVTRSATPTLTATPTASVGATQTPTATATVSAGATQTPTATATTAGNASSEATACGGTGRRDRRVRSAGSSRRRLVPRGSRAGATATRRGRAAAGEGETRHVRSLLVPSPGTCRLHAMARRGGERAALGGDPGTGVGRRRRPRRDALRRRGSAARPRRWARDRHGSGQARPPRRRARARARHPDRRHSRG